MSPFLLALAAAATTSVMIAPSHVSQESADAMFAAPDEWNHLLGAMDGFKTYGVQLVSHSQPIPFTSIDAEAMVRTLGGSKKSIGVEFGDLVAPTNAAENEPWNRWIAAVDAQLQPILDAGGKVESIHLDGPIRRLLGHGGGGNIPIPKMPYEQAVRSLAEFWKRLSERYPETKIGFLVNLPNYDYDEDLAGYVGGFSRANDGLTFRRIIDDVHQALTDLGVTMDFLEIDCPYGYYTQTQTHAGGAPVDYPETFRRLQDWCSEHAVALLIIVNQEMPPLAGGDPEVLAQTSEDLRFWRGTEAFLRRLHADGIQPDGVILQSWYPETPARLLPESDPASFAGGALRATRLAKELFEPSP